MSLFDDAVSITINNKQVKQITKDGNTIWPSFDGLVLSANSSNYSYANNDKATLYAQLTNNGDPANISGVTITFKKESTILGTANTDNTGLATLTDAYTTNGGGSITFNATVNNLTSSCNITDWDYYRSSSLPNGVLSVSNIPNLGSNKSIEAYFKIGSSGAYYFNVGKSSSICYLFEFDVTNKTFSILEKTSATAALTTLATTSYSNMSSSTCYIKFEGNTLTAKSNTKTITATASTHNCSYAEISKGRTGSISNIRINVF